MAQSLFVLSWVALASASGLYLGFGVMRDWNRRVTASRISALLGDLSILLFDSHDQATIAVESLANVNRRVLLDLAQNLALDINGEARERLRHLSRSTGLERGIMRRAKSRRWRNRVQAAQLHYLVTHPDFDCGPLLRDKHRMVRARAAESLTESQAVVHVEALAMLLRDPSLAVRMSAQNALLRAGAAAVEPLLVILDQAPEHVAQAMQVAANLPDPRLLTALAKYAQSPDPYLREITARALGNGSGIGSVELLRDCLNDASKDVRATAIVALQRLESRESVAAIGAMLSDDAWKVRRAAGYALDGLGAPGQLILRRALEADDPYARDMARQVLDGSRARSARSRKLAELVGAK